MRTDNCYLMERLGKLMGVCRRQRRRTTRARANQFGFCRESNVLAFASNARPPVTAARWFCGYAEWHWARCKRDISAATSRVSECARELQPRYVLNLASLLSIRIVRTGHWDLHLNSLPRRSPDECITILLLSHGVKVPWAIPFKSLRMIISTTQALGWPYDYLIPIASEVSIIIRFFFLFQLVLLLKHQSSLKQLFPLKHWTILMHKENF